jgi:hypothetical protein
MSEMIENTDPSSSFSIQRFFVVNACSAENPTLPGNLSDRGPQTRDAHSGHVGNLSTHHPQ